MAHFRGVVVVVRPVGPGGRRLLDHVTMSPWPPAHHESLEARIRRSETWTKGQQRSAFAEILCRPKIPFKIVG